MVFLNRPVAEGSYGSVVGVLAIRALAAGKEIIDSLRGKLVAIYEREQADSIEAYGLWRNTLPS